MSEQVKKPIYQRKWFLILAGVLVLSGFIGAISDNEEVAEGENNVENEEVAEASENEENDNAANEDSNDNNNEGNNNAAANNEEESEEAEGLTEDQVAHIEEFTEGIMEEEREFGDDFYLNEFEYDSEANRVTARIDMQLDPLPETAEEVEDHAISFANVIRGDYNDLEENFDVRVTLVTDVGDGQFILWGHGRSYEDGETSFDEESGMQLFD